MWTAALLKRILLPWKRPVVTLYVLPAEGGGWLIRGDHGRPSWREHRATRAEAEARAREIAREWQWSVYVFPDDEEWRAEMRKRGWF